MNKIYIKYTKNRLIYYIINKRINNYQHMDHKFYKIYILSSIYNNNIYKFIKFKKVGKSSSSLRKAPPAGSINYYIKFGDSIIIEN